MEFFKHLSEIIQSKVVKETVLKIFEDKFKILFEDQEFRYKADIKLMTAIVSSFQYEYIQGINTKDSIIQVDTISQNIYFIHQGDVNMIY